MFTAVEHVHTYATEYFDGLRNEPSFLPMFLFVGYQLLKLGLLICATVVLIVGISYGKLRLVSHKVGVALFVCAVVTFLGYWQVSPPGALIFLQGSKKWVEHEVDTIAIQNWLSTADGKYWDQHQTYDIREGFPAQFPTCLVSFNPKFIWFQHSDLDGLKTIRFGWGGGLSSWGFVVGEPGLKIPEREKAQISNSYIEYRRIVKPGVYVFNGG
jgi:hypothetical protein